ncbi:MAG: hypothetical protein V7603_5920 [Micromonosporaceae bacterium]
MTPDSKRFPERTGAGKPVGVTARELRELAESSDNRPPRFVCWAAKT